MHEVAYVSHKTVVKTRLRGSTKAKEDDVYLSKSIDRGLMNLESVRSKTQQEQFDKLKKGITHSSVTLVTHKYGMLMSIPKCIISEIPDTLTQ